MMKSDFKNGSILKKIIQFMSQSFKLEKTSKIFPPKDMNKIISFHDPNEAKKFKKGLNLLSTNPTKWPNTLKQFVGLCYVFSIFRRLSLKNFT